jgi:hypothetical protein
MTRVEIENIFRKVIREELADLRSEMMQGQQLVMPSASGAVTDGKVPFSIRAQVAMEEFSRKISRKAQRAG